MDPPLRSRLREAMRARADTEGWRALIGQHGTPLLVLDPYRVVDQCRLLASHLRGFRLHYAVKTSSHPAVLRAVAATGCGSTWRRAPEVDLVATLGLPARSLPQHQSDQEAHRHRPRLLPAYARSSSTIQWRLRNSRVCRTTSRCWCGSRSPTRRRNLTCRQSSAPTPPTRSSVVKDVLATGVNSAASAFTSAARGRPPTVPLSTARHARPRRPHRRHARRASADHRHRRRVSGQLPRADADDRRHRGGRRRGARRPARRVHVGGRAGPVPGRRQHDVVDQCGRQRRARRTLVALPRRRALRQLLERDDRGRAPADPGVA